MSWNSWCQVPPRGRTNAATASGSPQNFQMSTRSVTLVRNVAAGPAVDADPRMEGPAWSRRRIRSRSAGGTVAVGVSAGAAVVGDAGAAGALRSGGAGRGAVWAAAGLASTTAKSAAY